MESQYDPRREAAIAPEFLNRGLNKAIGIDMPSPATRTTLSDRIEAMENAVKNLHDFTQQLAQQIEHLRRATGV